MAMNPSRLVAVKYWVFMNTYYRACLPALNLQVWPFHSERKPHAHQGILISEGQRMAI